MKNPFTQKVGNNHAWFWMMLFFGIGMAILRPKYVPEEIVISNIPVDAPVSKVVTAVAKPKMVTKNGYLVKTTWFGVECKTTWCKSNVGKPRGQKVAVNYKKFGKPLKIYVPTWDKFYEVIGNTDDKTDVDIWCESDEACQKSVGSRKLLVNFIYK